MPAEPQDSCGREVQDHHDGGEHEHEQVADLDRGFGQGTVGIGVAVGLEGFADEGADDADAGDLFAQHTVDVVDLVLHAAEQRHEEVDEDGDDDEEDRHGDPHQPGQPGVFPEGHDDAADAHDRCRDHEVQGHEHQHLNLLDVVGVAGDEGGGSEFSDFEHRQVVDLPVDGSAEVAADAHSRAGAEVDRGDRGDDLHEADEQHRHARRPDEIGVSLGHTFVDDPGVEAGQVQRCDGRGQLQDDDQNDEWPVVFGVFQGQAE